MGVSLIHSCLISFERYLAVRFPTRYKDILTNGRVLVTVTLIWLSGTVYVLLPYIGFAAAGMLIGRTVIIALILIVTAVCYIAAFSEFKGTFTRSNLNQTAFRANQVAPGPPRNQALKVAPGPPIDQTVKAAPGPPLNQAVKVNQHLHNVSKVEKNSSSDSADQHLNKHLQSSSNRCRSGQIPRMKYMPRFDKDNTLLRPSPSWPNEVPSCNNYRDYSSELSAVSISSTNETLESDQFPHGHDGGKLRQLSNEKTRKQQSELSSSLRKTKEKKLGKTMLITVGILVACLLPSIIAYSLLEANESDMEVNWLILNWIHTLSFFNSSINPFWFCWRMQNLRKGVLKLVKRK